MTRAEKAANEAYLGIPKLKHAFQEGYEQAQKDLALTWEDMQRIAYIIDDIKERMDIGIIEPYLSSEQDIYEEALKRFNETK